MVPSLVVVTGFSSFEEVDDNPSAGVALALEADPPPGATVRSTVLPVSFARAPAALDELLASLEPRRPDLFLGLGVHKKGRGYRLEVRARGRLEGRERVDVDGVVASAATDRAGPELRTGLDVRALHGRLAGAGLAGLSLSEDAGGYVCERTYHHLLLRASALGRPGLFVHVPPIEIAPVEAQTAVVRSILAELIRSRGERAATARP